MLEKVSSPGVYDNYKFTHIYKNVYVPPHQNTHIYEINNDRTEGRNRQQHSNRFQYPCRRSLRKKRTWMVL
jgi:hypothetical protein